MIKDWQDMHLLDKSIYTIFFGIVVAAAWHIGALPAIFGLAANLIWSGVATGVGIVLTLILLMVVSFKLWKGLKHRSSK
jgi:hypothetical protein